MNYQFATLIIKIGSLFANCDGEYDNREKKFVENFITSLKEEMHFNEEQISMLLSMSNRTFTYEDVILDTKNMLLNFDEETRPQVNDVIQKFVSELIAIDGRYADEEIALQKKWNKSLGIR
ncbi:MAG: hypothetical protein MJZ53_02610 [Paludibacteraceae bacterium]|nr:hypothetical protein [Paludibacteraceae bacterium]